MLKDDKIFLADSNLAVETSGLGARLESIIRNNANYMGEWPSSTGGMTSGFVMGPVVGSVSESGKFSYEGQIYEPGKHGNARKTLFTSSVEVNGVTFEHTHDPSAMAGVFPFPHKIDVNYRLAAGELTTQMTVENLGNADMRFGCGLHPAFVWPLPGSSSKQGHILHLIDGLPEGTMIYRPRDGKVYSDALDRSPFDDKGSWSIKGEDFIGDGYFFVYPQNAMGKQQRLALSGDGDNSVSFDMKGWGGFGIWSKPGDDNRFICVEPFVGVPIIGKNNNAIPLLEEIDGLHILPPGKKFSASMNVSFAP